MHFFQASIASTVKASSMDDLAKLWHLRLGQASITSLQLLFPFVDFKNFKNNFICSIFAKASQHRLPFPKSTTKSSFPFQLIDIDVWGTLLH